jgi:hypothetical protein
MTGCCAPRGYDQFFDAKQARRDARRYRRRGLDRAARRLVAVLRAAGIEDATVLEVGGGVGAIQLELLMAGARSATNVELSPGYEEEAATLAGEGGVTGRIERRLEDFAAASEAVAPADLVILHRVVCCYPDPERLVGAAAAKTGRALVLSFPPDNAVVRLGARVLNLFCAVRGTGFRVYAHSREAILGPALRAGLAMAAEGRSGIWRFAAFQRLSG